MPDRTEYVQMFGSGLLVGTFLMYFVTNGYLHGFSVLNMFKNDVTSTIKEVGKTLKGGEEVVAVAAAPAVAAPAVVTTEQAKTAVTEMMGGFLKSMGFEKNILQELNVGMPSF
jgi:hypothetical protein